MSGPYKSPVVWVCWTPVGNTAIDSPQKILIQTTDNDKLFCSFYLWLYLNLNAFFEGGIFIVSITVTIRAWF